MKINSLFFVIVGLIIVMGLLACTPSSQPQASPAPLMSPTISPTKPPVPTATPTITLAPTFTPSPTPTPTSTPEFWAQAGTPLPPALTPISQGNAEQVSALAEWVGESVVDLEWIPGTLQLAIAHPDSIVFYNLASRELFRRLYPTGMEIVDIDFSADGSWLVSGSRRPAGEGTYASNLEVWYGPDSKPLGVLFGTQGGLSGLTFTPDNKNLLVTYTSPEPQFQGRIDFWNIPAWLVATQIDTGTLLDVAVSSDGLRMATTPDRYSISIWDLEKREILFRPLTSFTGAVNQLAFSPDRVKLASGHYDGTIRLWDALSGILLLEIPNVGIIDSLAFSPDGTVLAAGLTGDQSEILLYETNTGQLLNRLPGGDHAITSLLFSPDGQLFISGSYDGNIRLWGIRP